MTASLEALRAKLLESANKNDNNNNNKSKNTGGDNASYRFWDMADNASATVRFLPDADETNDFFWRKREVIKLPFAGVVGGEYPTEKEVSVTVPCINMFGMQCPIITATKHLWNSEETKPLARVYWKKISYIFQGLVTSSPLQEENPPENPIRRFVINKSIYDKIYDAILDPELLHMPTDYDAGRDFVIKKTKKGDWANYDSSKFSMNPRSLTEEERSIIDTFGLFDLKEALGAIPSSDHIAALSDMLKDSMDGKPFDMDSYGQFYRPYQNNDNTGTAAATNRHVDEVQSVADQAPTPKATDVKVQDAKAVLANLRLKAQKA